MTISLKARRVAAVGAAIAGIGSMSVVVSAAAYAQPPTISPADGFACPTGAGLQYVPDPDDSQAFYVCADGKQQDHQKCPPGTVLELNMTPPECLTPDQEDYPK
ncbi:carbohydrate-binding module family 14 protein [Mycobacterium sp. THU-M104]|uniref:carbohydrate-binding module family 14 protein n=1 Tax=Mycobacterium sp. THU-M104 TaxID=3410515 RepID=UPI003B9A7E37